MASVNLTRTFVLTFALLLLLASFEMEPVEAKLCQRRSKTWTGFCASSSNCDKQCREWEDAKHGACHFDFPGVACFCYFECKWI